MRPWYRIAAYLVSMGAGMVWFTHSAAIKAYFKHSGLHTRRGLLRAGLFLLAVVLTSVTMYGATSFYQDAHWTTPRLVMYTTFLRPVWVTALAIMAILWFAYPQSAIAKALSAPFW